MGIKEARKYKKMTQKQLAKAIGVDFTVISKYENGVVEPSVERLKSISKVLDVPIDYLIGDVLVETTMYQSQSHEFSFSDREQLIEYEIMLRECLIAQSEGKCELCGKVPPQRTNGESTLEMHYVHWLSRGGTPVFDNAVVLCSACHRKVHVVNSAVDDNILQDRLLSREDSYSDEKYHRYASIAKISPGAPIFSEPI